MDRQFSPASDVWSFGVLIWEMFNPTKLPYEKYDNMGYAAKVLARTCVPLHYSSASYSSPPLLSLPSFLLRLLFSLTGG